MATVLFNKIKLGGTNITSLSHGSSEIKYVKQGDGTLYYDIQSSTTYDKPSVSLSYGSLATAKGGILSPSLSYSQKWRKVGYSGNTYEQTAYTSGATVSYSISGTGATIDSSTGVVTWASLGTTISDGRTAEVTVTVTKSGKSNTAKYTVRLGANSRTVKSTSGGVVTYGAVTAGTIKNATVPAAGGSGTATAGNGSQPWSKTAVITTYEYTSGSTLSEQTAAATSGTNTISPSVASISATGSNLGTTEKAAATLKLQAVKWSGGGGYSKSGTMYVYQEANEITNTTWTYDSVTVTNHGYANDIPASGGTVYGYGGTGSQTKTPTYTWTSTKTSDGTSVACSVTCGNYSGVYTGNLRTTETDRTYIGNSTATLTGEGGKTAKCSVSVYQEANIVESSEQYDGPYYQGGVTTYGSITAGSITPTSVSDIPASGGSITFTAGNGSQSYSTTKKEVRYRYRDKYTSGSYGSIYYGSWSTHTPASSGSESVTPDEKTKTISGSNLGTTIKSRTSLGSKTFTWSANGKSTSKNTTTVYQEANALTGEYKYEWAGTPSVSYVTASYNGDTLRPTVSATQYKLPYYTSGETPNATSSLIINVTPSFSNLSVSGTGASVYSTITGAIKWTANSSTSSRDVTVSGKLTANNISTNFSTTASQEGKPAGITVYFTGCNGMVWESGSITAEPYSSVGTYITETADGANGYDFTISVSSPDNNAILDSGSDTMDITVSDGEDYDINVHLGGSGPVYVTCEPNSSSGGSGGSSSGTINLTINDNTYDFSISFDRCTGGAYSDPNGSCDEFGGSWNSKYGSSVIYLTLENGSSYGANYEITYSGDFSSRTETGYVNGNGSKTISISVPDTPGNYYVDISL